MQNYDTSKTVWLTYSCMLAEFNSISGPGSFDQFREELWELSDAETRNLVVRQREGKIKAVPFYSFADARREKGTQDSKK